MAENTKNHLEIKKLEQAFLEQEAKNNPYLFEQKTFYDNTDFLINYGIFLPNKEKLPDGFLKFSPTDFIVEEIDKDGEVSTIDFKSIEKNYGAQQDEKMTVFATLVKCGISTTEAIEELTKLLDCNATQIQYSGLKDKHAITAQKISIRQVPIEKISNVSSKNLFLKNLTFGKGVTEKGNLIGNRFTILLRTDHLNISQEIIENLVKKIEEIKKFGFYNFYYLQRFGAPRFINIKWGLEILRGNHKETVRSFLCDSSERELRYFSNLRKMAGENFGNWQFVKNLFKNLPIICANENIILDYLIENPNDFKGALRQIPDQTMLWVYAISSLLFNEKISFLIQTQNHIPEKLPLFLSLDKNDALTYEDSLKALDLFPPPFKNLNDFPNIRPEKRLVNTTEKVKINKIEIVEEGIILSFDLSKGDYATTFLSHLFNLVNGKTPEWVSKNVLDIKKILEESDNQKTFDHFKEMLELRKN